MTDHQQQSWTPPTTSGTPSKYQVTIIRKACIGDGSCVAFAPQVFELDAEKIATVINQFGADDATKLLAAQVCPTKAIIVTDVTTGKQVWPIVETDLKKST